MKRAYLITEAQSDVEILKTLLPRSIVRSVKLVVVGDDSYSIISSTSTLLIARRVSVAAVINAHTLNAMKIRERVAFLRSMIHQASTDVRYEIFPAIPEIESVFFQDRRFIEKLAKKTFTEMEWNFAKLNPKEALTYLLGNSAPLNSKILHRLTDETVRVLQQHPLIARLSEFLSSVLESNKFAKAA